MQGKPTFSFPFLMYSLALPCNLSNGYTINYFPYLRLFLQYNPNSQSLKNQQLQVLLCQKIVFFSISCAFCNELVSVQFIDSTTFLNILSPSLIASMIVFFYIVASLNIYATTYFLSETQQLATNPSQIRVYLLTNNRLLSVKQNKF